MDWAQLGCGWGTGDDKILTLGCLPILISGIINWLLIFAGSVAVFFIIIAGVKLLTSQGDPKRVEGARNTLTWAVIGLVLILASIGIVNIMSSYAGVPLGTLGLNF